MNKRGIELSVNFFVVLVISLVVFGLGLKLLSDVMSKSDDMMYWTFKQLDSELQNFNCQPGEVVCVSTREKTIKPGEHDVLGIKIVNLGPERDFAVIVYPDKNSISPNFKFEGIYIIKLGYGEDNQIQMP